MTVTINGTTGIARPLGSAGSPSDVNTSDATTGLYFPASNTVGISTAGTNALYIDASQNVGIGTSSPSSFGKFVVSGTGASVTSGIVNTTVTGFGTLTFFDGINAKGQIWCGNGSYASYGGAGSINYSANSGPHVWLNNYNEYMRLDASGNLLVGTTSVIKTAKFSLVGGAASLPSINLGSSTSNAYIYEGATNVISFRTGAAGSDRYFSFDTSGNGNALNGSWVNGSDQRLKENVQPLSNGLASIMSLSPVQYNRIGQTNKEIGFIAQDLQKIVPEVVYDSGEYLGVSYGNMVALLTKALQELSAEVTALKAKVGA